MASKNKRMTSSPATHKMAPSNKPRPVDNSKRKFSSVPDMSPEARRAILLAREDSKSNNLNSQKKQTSSTSHSTIDSADTSGSVDANNNTNVGSRSKGDSVRSNRNITKTSNPSSAIQASSTHSPKVSSSRPPRFPHTATSRSRSTLSQNEPPFSMSDNNELSSHLGTNTTSNASVYTSNQSSGHNNNHNNNGHRNGNTSGANINTAEFDPDDDNDSALPNDDSFDDEEEETTFNKSSFVQALDKALERNDVSRLKGDITDLKGVSKPGTVRALNGGRLTNAQEVVVNVCHDDDTELVFHDDDEESVDTAKAISQIRVNIWMEYNSRFPPDNDEFDVNSTEESKPTSQQVRQRHSSPAVMKTTREKSFVSPNARPSDPHNDSSTRRVSNVDREKYNARNTNNTTTNTKRTPSNSRILNITPSPTPSRRGSVASSSRGKVSSGNSSSIAKSTAPSKSRR